MIVRPVPEPGRAGIRGIGLGGFPRPAASRLAPYWARMTRPVPRPRVLRLRVADGGRMEILVHGSGLRIVSAERGINRT